ncbi:hypothetical protein MYA_3868 [Burkholderia sp. KJ006]|nr:hypothetical protein MYA_3868 [Burkholderia sp. KJ006]
MLTTVLPAAQHTAAPPDAGGRTDPPARRTNAHGRQGRFRL